MKTCTLYVVRHGQSEANRDHICAGQMDSPLSELGVRQAKEAKQALSNVHFDTVYSSDLQRASKTVAIIAGKPVAPEHQLADLRERDMGKLQGHSNNTWFELTTQFDEKYKALPLEERWRHSYADYIEGNGPLSARFLKALRGIAREHLGETVLIGTHAGCVRTTLVKLGYAEETALPPGSFDNGAYITLACDGQKLTIEHVTGVHPTHPPRPNDK
jgi:probable phosphoglycerate mutase